MEIEKVLSLIPKDLKSEDAMKLGTAAILIAVAYNIYNSKKFSMQLNVKDYFNCNILTETEK